MNKSNINEQSAGTEVDSNSTAQNQHVSQPNVNMNVSGCSGYRLQQSNKSDLEYLSEWIDLKTGNSDETATMIIEKITEMIKTKI